MVRFTRLIVLCLLSLLFAGCTGTVSRRQMVQTATFENKVLADTENRLMDGFDAKLLDPKLHDELNPYIYSCREAANDMTRIAHDPRATSTVFQLALDQFVAALAPLTQANANAVQTKRSTTQPSTRLPSRVPTATRSNYVPPSVTTRYDASRFNKH